MRSGLSTTSRAEITSWYAKAYVKAGKKDKGRILDEVVGVTGWSRDNARRRLTGAAKRRPGSGRQGRGSTGWNDTANWSTGTTGTALRCARNCCR